MRTFTTLTLLVILCFLSKITLAEDVVCIQPLGAYDENFFSYYAKAIEYVYGVPTQVKSPLPMPKEAYSVERDRYRSEDILPVINKINAHCFVTIGVTNLDIAVEKGVIKEYGVMGVALEGGYVGVVSTRRMNFLSAELLPKLAVKTVLHEIAHALGAPHHPNRNCLVAEWDKELNHERIELCLETKSLIEEFNGISLPRHQTFDWEEVIQ